MPNRTVNAPDWFDVEAIIGSIRDDYSLLVLFTTTVRAEGVLTIGKAYRGTYAVPEEVVYQAKIMQPINTKATFAQTCYTLAFDLWCQMDGGGATAAQRGPTYGWSGSVEVPRRRR